ncbi:MAG: MGMT family protein [Candidatus Norongarragalinales archaeon]
MDFTEKVHKAAARILKGRVSTYALVAKAIGKPRAARAVGNALNKSPGMPKCPCHRVVKSDGTLGGFESGPAAKKRLLSREGIRFKGSKVRDFKRKLYAF